MRETSLGWINYFSDVHVVRSSTNDNFWLQAIRYCFFHCGDCFLIDSVTTKDLLRYSYNICHRCLHNCYGRFPRLGNWCLGRGYTRPRCWTFLWSSIIFHLSVLNVWHINSSDYTLHYGAMIPKDGNIKQMIR